MSNLIMSWRESIKNRDMTLVEAVKQMNSFTRMNTLSQHIWEMEKGKRDIPVPVHNYILSDIYYELHLNRDVKEILEGIQLPGRVK